LAYPLRLSFKVIALASQFSVVDSNGKVVGWAAQKLLRLKEAVSVFSDSSRKELLYSIAADRVLDFGARYHFSDAQGNSLGAVQRAGLRSIWKARYDILDTAGGAQTKGQPTNVIMTVREENPWIKVLDGLISAIPLAELFTGYFLHPSYAVSRPDGTVVMRIQKQAAFFESRFSVERTAPLSPLDEQRVLLSLIMLVLLERQRG
jgi:uncharacterized protein YxjI